MKKHLIPSKELQNTQDILRGYHGSKCLKNIPEFTSSQLYKELKQSRKISLDLEMNVTTVLDQIAEILSIESVLLQEPKYQKQMGKHAIIPSSRLSENQRIEFYNGKNIYEWVELIFSPEEFYFTLNDKNFKKDDKQYNRGIFQNALDTVVIEREKVSDSSLETLDITLDPDCQNLKEIFKKMTPLNYQDMDKKKHTIRIHEYDGKYIVFAAHKTIFDATQPVTKGEQRKQDVTGHMSVYPDLFSIVRREEHIMDTNQEKQDQYQDIKKKILSSLKEIDRNRKEYSIRVQQNVQEIIAEIDGATSVKILADKLYHLHKITGKHSERDKNLLEASMRNFTQRIAQLIGISSYTELHLLELNDVLEEQNGNLELFYNQMGMVFAEKNPKYTKFLFMLENYYRTQKGPLKEPFLMFDKQIRQYFGDIAILKTKHPRSIMLKAQILVTLQRKCREIYVWKHEYKRGVLSLEELQEKLLDTSSDESFKQEFPELYDMLFAEITAARASFSLEFTPEQINRFFDELSDLHQLQTTIDAVLKRL